MKPESRSLCTKKDKYIVPDQIRELDGQIKKLQNNKKGLNDEVSVRLKAIDIEQKAINDLKKNFHANNNLQETIQVHSDAKKRVDELRSVYVEKSKYNELLDHKINNLKARDKFNTKLNPLVCKTLKTDFSQDIDMAENGKYIKIDQADESGMLGGSRSKLNSRDIEDRIRNKAGSNSAMSKGGWRKKIISNKGGSDEIYEMNNRNHIQVPENCYPHVKYVIPSFNTYTSRDKIVRYFWG